ncbi:MAG: hypothetical protein Q8O59_00945 [bacterium]|nr:hypothetical protein [bacterium]
MKPKKLINTKWCGNLAYALGLLTTDGSLSKDGRHFDFTSKDKELIKLFAKCLGLQNTIGKKTSGFTGRKDCLHIQFGDINFYRWCLIFGLMPNKSKTLKGLKVPNKYFFDFLRGCFDGDGSIYAYWDPRWHSSYMFYIQFCSASQDFIRWLKKRVDHLLGQRGEIIDISTSRVWQLRYAKKDSLIVFKKMFHTKNLPHLKRKFLKANKIFKIENKHNSLPR